MTTRLPSAEELIRGAELETGHTDWETEYTGNPYDALRILLSDIEAHSHLGERGVRRMYRKLHDTLCARLEYIADRKRYPGIAQEQIKAPIFILGLPRSGTTFLHNLLASDPADRAPRLFEMQIPAPQNPEPLARDLRVQRCREGLAYEGMLDEDWLAVHPMDPERAEESIFLWELFLLSNTYSAKAEVPNYLEYLYSRDFLQIYREERAFLQYLQHTGGQKRWVIKSPIHVRFLREIVEVFPDALFVHCHRDTAKVYPSIASMAAVLHSKYSDEPPSSGAILGDYDGTWADALAFRDLPGMAQRFVDVQFLEFRANPLGTVQRIYDAFGIAIDEQRLNVMAAWLAEDKARVAKSGHHNYSLADAGMTETDIDRLTGDYLKAFAVPLER